MLPVESADRIYHTLFGETTLRIAELDVSENPASHFSYYALAIAQHSLGRDEAAMEAIDRALTIRPGHRLTTRLKNQIEVGD